MKIRKPPTSRLNHLLYGCKLLTILKSSKKTNIKESILKNVKEIKEARTYFEMLGMCFGDNLYEDASKLGGQNIPVLRIPI